MRTGKETEKIGKLVQKFMSGENESFIADPRLAEAQSSG